MSYIFLLCYSNSNIWSGTADIPVDRVVQFRYCVCIVADVSTPKHMPKKIMVRRWETNLNPRNIEKDGNIIVLYLLNKLKHIRR